MTERNEGKGNEKEKESETGKEISTTPLGRAGGVVSPAGGGTPADLQEWFKLGVDLRKLYSN